MDLKSARRRRATRLELGLLLIVAALIFLTLFSSKYAYFSWDLYLAQQLQSVEDPGFLTLMRFISWPGRGWTPYVMVGATGLLLLAYGWRPEAGILVGGVALGSLFTAIFKDLVNRPRPAIDLVSILTDYTNPSFPSGHVSLYVQFFGFLLFLSLVRQPPGYLKWFLVIAFGSMMIGVGFSRIYLGAHWPSDVLGAYTWSSLWLLAMIHYYQRQQETG